MGIHRKIRSADFGLGNIEVEYIGITIKSKRGTAEGHFVSRSDRRRLQIYTEVDQEL